MASITRTTASCASIGSSLDDAWGRRSDISLRSSLSTGRQDSLRSQQAGSHRGPGQPENQQIHVRHKGVDCGDFTHADCTVKRYCVHTPFLRLCDEGGGGGAGGVDATAQDKWRGS